MHPSASSRFALLGVCVWQRERAGRDRPGNSGNYKEKRKCEPKLFTLREINIWNKLLEQAAKAKAINEFNRYLLCLLEEERSKEKVNKRKEQRGVFLCPRIY